MKRILILLVLMLGGMALRAQVKVACIGDSVTYGYGIEDREHDSYPSQLQRMLGSVYEVRNFGHSGATLLEHGHRPYTKLEEFTQSLDFKADIVVIHLGLNDTDPRDWPDWSDEFKGDYRSLIGSYRKANPQARIWICLMTPIFHGHSRFLSGTRDWHAQIQDEIRQIAQTDSIGLIDLYTPLIDRCDLFADSLHPDAEGAGIIAKTVYSAVTGDFGGLSMSPMYSDGMVLQRGKETEIAGTGNTGSEITVELREPSENKRKKGIRGATIFHESAKVSEHGRWAITLPSEKEGGPYELEISDGLRSLTYKDVWIGEVWICSGQSNMVFKVCQSTTSDEDIMGADPDGKVRLFYLKENWLTDDVEWSEEALDSVRRLQYFTPSGWERCTQAAVSDFSAIGYHFGKTLADSLGCHVGIINCAVGGATTESWTSGEMLRWEFPEILYDWNNGDFGQAWARGRAKKNIELNGSPLQRHPYQPGYLFAAATRILDGYGIKGIVWYQGESNAHNIEAHEKLFRLMVRSWRKNWNNSVLPFEMIQLSGISTRHSWPKFRDSQRKLSESIEGVSLVVSSDQGDSTDVHPRNKRAVGERAAASALGEVYAMDVIPCGPQYLRFSVEGSGLRLFFSHAEGMRVSGGFEIAGKDGIYHTAYAEVEGDTIIVSSPDVCEPCAVRYGWQPNPAGADLVNRAGYPCSTFKDERFSY